MTKPDWPSIKADYVETAATLAEVQAKWGVKRGTLSARATREDWTYQKQQFAAKLEQKRQEEIIAKRAAHQANFEKAVIAGVFGQLNKLIKLKDEHGDAATAMKLAKTLETLQRVGTTVFRT